MLSVMVVKGPNSTEDVEVRRKGNTANEAMLMNVAEVLESWCAEKVGDGSVWWCGHVWSCDGGAQGALCSCGGSTRCGV